MKLARVFPRKTNATPNDDLVFFGDPPKDIEVDEAHISTTFTYDKEKAEKLAELWSKVTTVKLGGPAYNDPGGEFQIGLYIKKGYVITSRGCANNCWFCSVPKREGVIREIPIQNGYNLLDSNILGCSKQHIQGVFKMLSNQAERAVLTGGLESRILKDWHINLLWGVRPDRMYFAYDDIDDYEPLVEAGKKLRYADFTRHHMYCYVLIGYAKDTFANAEKRLIETWSAGFMPMAMLWKNNKGDVDEEWRKFQRVWARPAIIRSNIKNNFKRYSVGSNSTLF